MCITVHIVQPERVAAPREPHYAHEPRAQDRWDHGNATPAHDDGKQASAISVGFGQENLSASLADGTEDGTPFSNPSFLDQGDIPAKGR